MEAMSHHPTLLRRSKHLEGPMSSNLSRLFDRVALTFFTALAMVPVLTVAAGGLIH
jgi:hypothetical protein